MATPVWPESSIWWRQKVVNTAVKNVRHILAEVAKDETFEEEVRLEGFVDELCDYIEALEELVEDLKKQSRKRRKKKEEEEEGVKEKKVERIVGDWWWVEREGRGRWEWRDEEAENRAIERACDRLLEEDAEHERKEVEVLQTVAKMESSPQ